MRALLEALIEVETEKGNLIVASQLRNQLRHGNMTDRKELAKKIAWIYDNHSKVMEKCDRILSEFEAKRG